MERDMLSMGFSEDRKEELRRRWIQNETDYLREKRRKVDVSAFIKLKTIGHGELLRVEDHIPLLDFVIPSVSQAPLVSFHS